MLSFDTCEWISSESIYTRNIKFAVTRQNKVKYQVGNLKNPWHQAKYRPGLHLQIRLKDLVDFLGLVGMLGNYFVHLRNKCPEQAGREEKQEYAVHLHLLRFARHRFAIAKFQVWIVSLR